jgi:hypothetical protein
MNTLVASPADDWIQSHAVHGALPLTAVRICEALKDGPCSESFIAFLNEQEQFRLCAATRARLPRQAELMRAALAGRLCHEFATMTGYTLLGSRLESSAAARFRRQLMTIDLAQASRAIPAGPCVFQCEAVEDYAKPIPTPALCALAEARSEAGDIFENVMCIEPVLRRNAKSGTPEYFRALSQMPEFSPTRTIDPLIVGFLPGAPEHAFCIAHWD